MTRMDAMNSAGGEHQAESAAGGAPGDSVVGCTDGFRQGYVEGWAWRPKTPHDTVVVELLVNGQLAGECTACLPRPDLSTAGIGNGQHAFAIPYVIEPDAPAVLRAVVRSKDGTVLPPGEFDIAVSNEAREEVARRRSVASLEAVFGPITAATPPERRAMRAPVEARPHFVLYAARGGGSASGMLGMPEYSYVFVLRGFREVLRKLGTVHVVHDPAAEVNDIYRACMARGEACLFLSFAPPQSTYLGLACPAIPVIAWEFSTIPTGSWHNTPGGSDAREDWRLVLRQTGRAITISDFAARALRSGMGADFPVAALPTPVWDRMAGLRARLAAPDAPRAGGPATLVLDGFVWDSRVEKLSLMMRAPPFPVVKRDAAPSRVRGPLLALAVASAARRVEPPPPPPPQSAPSRKTVRQRVGVTLRLGRQWYREAVRDALPPRVLSAINAVGRAAYALRTPPAAVLAPSSATIELTPAPPPADAARYVPAPDAPPFAEPALAEFWPDPAPPPPPADTAARVSVDGVIFTAVLSPKDGRKNWQDILTAFIAAFTDTPDATLILKMIGADAAYWWWEFYSIVRAVKPFKCRVLVLNGYLEDAQYEALIAVTHFVVNASLAEGQCLPLVEFMSAGRPAIAPLHTAMLDYIRPQNAMIVASSVEFCAWPHDPRNRLNTSRHRIEWPSLRDAYGAAFRIVRGEPARYAEMAEDAASSVRAYCADDVVGPALAAFLGLGDEAVRAAGWQPKTAPPVEAMP